VAQSKTRSRKDLVQDLGPLAFASRLKRLADRLHRDVSRFYRNQSLDFEARWFPVLYVLKDRSPMAVTDLAGLLGLTHPAINQIAGDMLQHGLIDSVRDSGDERRHLLGLTAKARRLLKDITPLWGDVREATSDLITESGCDLLAALERIEKRLDAISMSQRLEAINASRADRTTPRKRVSHSKRVPTRASGRAVRKTQ
jgi:DNA-binding MarR family transcriptional regulator